jgi:hypothetical protein
MYAYAKNMLVGLVLAVVTAVAPVWAADDSADFSALSDSRMAVQKRTALGLLSTEQLDSVKGGGGDTQNCTQNQAGLINANVGAGVGALFSAGAGAGNCQQF